MIGNRVCITETAVLETQLCTTSDRKQPELNGNSWYHFRFNFGAWFPLCGRKNLSERRLRRHNLQSINQYTCGSFRIFTLSSRPSITFRRVCGRLQITGPGDEALGRVMVAAHI